MSDGKKLLAILCGGLLATAVLLIAAYAGPRRSPSDLSKPARTPAREPALKGTAHLDPQSPPRIANRGPEKPPPPSVHAPPVDAPPAWEHEGDSDGDGLSDEYELRVGLDPHSVDTDGDGLPDEDEEAAPGTTHFEAQGRAPRNEGTANPPASPNR